MRYKVGDTVVLSNGNEVTIEFTLDNKSADDGQWMYGVRFADRFGFSIIKESDIDHYATEFHNLKEITEEFDWKQSQKEFFKLIDEKDDTKPEVDFCFDAERPWFADEDSDFDNSFSFNIKINGAKEYRDKLEELHRHIETVERTIEQLNEMEMTVEVEDD